MNFEFAQEQQQRNRVAHQNHTKPIRIAGRGGELIISKREKQVSDYRRSHVARACDCTKFEFSSLLVSCRLVAPKKKLFVIIYELYALVQENSGSVWEDSQKFISWPMSYLKGKSESQAKLSYKIFLKGPPRSPSVAAESFKINTVWPPTRSSSL